MLPPDFIEPATIAIPAGTFLMGSERHSPNERPVHGVWIDPFQLAKFPVTRREYALFAAATRRALPIFWDEPHFQHSDQPVVGANWFDAVAYCQWLSSMTSRSYRLPTEAEREKAARGGIEGTTYPWGAQLPSDHQGGRDTPLHCVGLDGPNGYGLYDMSAGVHEWCFDFYDKTFYASSPDRNPSGPASGNRRAARGGSWRHRIRFSRCAARSSLAPDKQFSDFGFRCALAEG
jgi:formylglycine-generating enzyme required for sulfatase activity